MLSNGDLTVAKAMSNNAVEMRAIDKAFGPVKALDAASLCVPAGSIHGLVGQNGAGKSTIIKVLAGIYKPDAGTISVFGEELTSTSPALMERKGVHFIHQDRLLSPTSTVAEAIYLNNEPRLGPFVDYREMNRCAAALLKQHFEVDLNPQTLIRDLSTARQKIVQITRALAHEARLLVLDEPTAALVQQEVESLFRVLRRLRDGGIAVIFISHYMQEIADLCDEVTILRNGRDVGLVQTKHSSIDEIVGLMTDRDTAEMYPRRSLQFGMPRLQVENLSLKNHFEEVSFEVRAGEILGLIGLLGSGNKEVLQCLFGLKQPDSGRVLINGQERHLKVPGDAVDNGIALIPEDRRAQGVAVGLSVKENISIASLKQFTRRGIVQRRQEAEAVGGLIAELGVMTPGHDTLVKNLSGGNQQKVVVAKWLSCDSHVYLLDDPTVAVDVGAKVEIYKLMNRLAADGAAQVIISSDLEEIAEMCDRILVIYRGRITGEFRKGDVKGDELLAAASGARDTNGKAGGWTQPTNLQD